jgi:SAM-dependent methyltransferase
MEASKNEKMVAFWSERARLYGNDPRANTNDIWLREVEIAYVGRAIQESPAKRVLDFGCANGFSTRRLAQSNPSSMFVGVDINTEMIRLAMEQNRKEPLANLAFQHLDILREPFEKGFNFIYAIRVFQNMDSLEFQKRIADRLCDLLSAGGRFLYVESYLDGYLSLNDDRESMGLSPLPIHPHLTLLSSEFDSHVANKVKLVRRDFVSSSYYLITRLVYSYLAKINDEPIDYNHPMHQVAAMVPQVGNYGPQRASLYVKA